MRACGALVGALDQGTSSTRFLVFEAQTGKLLSKHQVPISCIYPKEGWVEVDPKEILRTVHECIEGACSSLRQQNIPITAIKAVGITNQRETTIVWDQITGEPLHNAIVWLDMRTQLTVERLIDATPARDQNHLKDKTGLPISTYFSAVKLRWLLDNCAAVQSAVKDGRALFGTVDTWILWNLSGGTDGGVHLTDVTNASRTMLFNIHTLEWDSELCEFFNIPMSILPGVRSSSEIYATMTIDCLSGVPISGCLGDQSAALVGQLCFKSGQAKNTYGTGCFLLCNTGEKPVSSAHGLLTTIAYQLGPRQVPSYALEGSVAIAGGMVQWLRDNLGIIESSEDLEQLAAQAGASCGCYFVPAFSGLYAPYWDPTARGIICGLTRHTKKSHIAFATMEAVCFQTGEIFEAMKQDSGNVLALLQVDGGMTSSNLLMQLQADILGIPVARPSITETTSLGAAIAAGMAEGVGVWHMEQKDQLDVTFETFNPQVAPEESTSRLQFWRKAVERSRGWETTVVHTKH